MKFPNRPKLNPGAQNACLTGKTMKKSKDLPQKSCGGRCVGKEGVRLRGHAGI